MKLDLTDLAVALWGIFICAAFFLPVAFGWGSTELVPMARYVYTGVLAASLIGIAVRCVRKLGR